MKNGNYGKPAEAVVKSVEFHPSANVLLTAGFHKTLDLFQVRMHLYSSLLLALPLSYFLPPSLPPSPPSIPPLPQVDGQVNPKLQSVHVEQFPIVTARFSRDGREVIMAGGKRSFYIYDMMAGKVERAFVLSSKSIAV